MSADNSPIAEMARINIITGCILSAVSLVAILWLIPSHIVVKGDVSAGLSPRLLSYVAAVSLLILSLILSISNALKLRNPDNLVEEESEENEILGFGVNEIINCLIMAVASCLYMILLKYAGFLIASALMIGISLYISRNRGIVLPLIAVGFPLAMKLFFWYVLQVRLP